MTSTIPRMSWAAFSAAPHRMFFWSGALYTVVAMGVWSHHQVGLYTSPVAPVMWHVPFPLAHGFMMLYGVFTFYLFAFLLTTFPRWLNGESVPRALYVPAWVLTTLGAHLNWIGLYLSSWLSVVGVLLLGAGFALCLWACLRVYLAAKGEERTQQSYILFGLLMGLLGILLTALAIASGERWAWSIARWVGIYLFLLQVVFAVVYRMVPFFTSMVTPEYNLQRSALALPLWSVALLGRSLVSINAGDMAILWAWPFDLLLFAVLAHELVLWRFWRAEMPPLLRILYLALGWFLVSFVLSAAEGIWMVFGGIESGGPSPFGNAALHALTVGGFGGLLLGISTRVSLGHSGRGLATDRLINWLFLLFQAVPLARVLPEVLGYWWLAAKFQGFWSGFGWVLIFGLWFVYVSPVLLRPRSDGKPG